MHTPTVPIRPHLTEGKTQLNTGFTSWVYSGFTGMDTVNP